MEYAPAQEFGALLAALVKAQGSRSLALEVLDQHCGRARTVLKAAVEGSTLTNAEALAALRSISNGFLDALRPQSAFDYVLANGARRVGLRTKLAATIITADGSDADEGQPKPLSALSLASATVAPRKAVSTVVISAELARMAGEAGVAFIQREVRGAHASAVNAMFISILLAVASGAQTVQSSGFTPQAIRRDIGLASELLAMTGGSALFLLVSLRNALRLSLMSDDAGQQAFPGMTSRGGELGGLTALATDALGDDQFVLLDASSLAADTGPVLLDVTRHADVQMSDAPAGGAAPMTSLWQVDALAIRCERFFGAEPITDDGVAVIDGIELPT